MPMTSPFDLFAKSLNVWTETTLKAYETWAQMAVRQTEQMMSFQTLSPLSAMMMPDETRIREGFQKAADMNLNAWTEMAEKISALPDWARAPVEVPGRTLVDMFDMFRSFPTFETPTAEITKMQSAAKPTPTSADDLTAIKGIGPKMAEKLENYGIVSLSQIASWTKADIDQLDAEFSLGERITRQGWVGQAKALTKPVLH